MINWEFTVLALYYGNPDKDHLACINKIVQAGIPFIPIYDCPYLDIGRSYAIAEGRRLTPDAKAFVFIDHDMIFELEAVVGLAQRLIENDLDVAAVAYSMRKPGFMLSCKPTTVKRVNFYEPGYVEVNYAGTGFMAINKKVIDKLDEIMPTYYFTVTDKSYKPYFERYIQNECYYTDDVAFCYRIRDLGMKVWIDTEPRIYHRGKYDYAIEDGGMSVPTFKSLIVDFSDKKDDNTGIKE